MADRLHYPHDLLDLLVETTPRLVKSKKDVILFFEGAGADAADLRVTRRPRQGRTVHQVRNYARRACLGGAHDDRRKRRASLGPCILLMYQPALMRGDRIIVFLPLFHIALSILRHATNGHQNWANARRVLSVDLAPDDQ